MNRFECVDDCLRPVPRRIDRVIPLDSGTVTVGAGGPVNAVLSH